EESALVATEAQDAAFDTVYFGGGTPSRIPSADLARLHTALARHFRLLAGAEVTLEANPDDVAPASAAAWREAGVNRVSLGVQSFSDRELAAVGRRHDAGGARAALETLLAAGLSVSGDLILGLPEQTSDSFARSVRELAGSGVDHVSVYLLETEKSRAIEEDRRLRPERYLSDDAQADLWLELSETLARAGLAHYEISNWARPGREARHNLKYWRREPTLGLGVSAHELWDDRRRANVSALPVYLESIRKGKRPTALDQPIGAEAAAREKLMLGLRLSDGVPRSELESFVAGSPDSRLREDYQAWREEGVLAEREGRVLFSERGFLLSNEVLCRFV
ncbi:MAG: coproporphyrinogen III oxidase family protein, partial [Acidobacteriota bacterium]|nr:coproporphyrinogen III oxidase family protein [Acidobacteriota bacterium]